MSLFDRCATKVGVVLPYIHSVIADVAGLLARITIGQAFMQAGWGKLHDIENKTEQFAAWGIPAPHAHVIGIGCLELIGGVLLILGLGVRPFAFLLSCTMAVALMTAHRQGFMDALTLWPDSGLTDLTPWVFILILLPLVAYGGGRVGLDRLVWRWWNRRSTTLSAG